MDVRTGALVLLLICLNAARVGEAAPRPSPPPRPSPTVLVAGGTDLFSARARRRAASLMRLRLYELRLEDLERVRAAIKGTLSVDDLVRKNEIHKR